MAKTRKVMDVNDGGKHFAVIIHEGNARPYCVYRYGWKDRGAYASESKTLEYRSLTLNMALLYIAEQY